HFHHAPQYSQSVGPPPHFLLILWRVIKPFTHWQASLPWVQAFDPDIIKYKHTAVKKSGAGEVMIPGDYRKEDAPVIVWWLRSEEEFVSIGDH
ncbi:MAG: hypothetical protein K5770_07820, partial [Lachnospiraceae bacterium]|nr:hypothetical protein [Lachnospiraceae bacterium]